MTVASTRRAGAEPTRPPALRVAYVMSRFPQVTETFIAREMDAVARRGVDVRVYALLRDRRGPVQATAAPFVSGASFALEGIGPLVSAQWHWLRRRPAPYLRVWRQTIAAYCTAPSGLVRAGMTVAAGARFARDAERDGVEHLHAHYATYPALIGLVVQALTGIPYTVTAHAHDLYVSRRMLREKLSAAQRVITISEYNRRLIVDVLGEARSNHVCVVRCGIDLERFAPRPRSEGRVGPSEIVCVASLQDYKGHPVLIEACRQLAERDVQFHCTLIGDGEARAALEHAVSASGLDDIVEFAGARDEAGVVDALARADIVVQPSVVTPSGKTEGLPNALMEAMAMEKPVVASDVTGMRELVDDGVNGLVVPPGDATALAAAIESLAADCESRTRLGTAGRRTVVSDYDIERAGQQMADILAAHSGGH